MAILATLDEYDCFTRFDTVYAGWYLVIWDQRHRRGTDLDLQTRKTATGMLDEVWSAFYRRVDQFWALFYTDWTTDRVTEMTLLLTFVHVSG